MTIHTNPMAYNLRNKPKAEVRREESLRDMVRRLSTGLSPNSTTGPTGTPSKRSIRNKSGRDGRRQRNNILSRSTYPVRGYKNPQSAIYAPLELMNPRLPQDDDPKSPAFNPLVPARLCTVLTDEQERTIVFTNSPGAGLAGQYSWGRHA
jgi:hypothetical protein